jgi:hypothetical protein
MVTALDSSVLLDVLLGDERHILESKAALRQAHREGELDHVRNRTRGDLPRAF